MVTRQPLGQSTQVRAPGWGRPLAMALLVSSGMGFSGFPRTQAPALYPAAWPWTVTKSARSITLRQFPQEKTPGIEVWRKPSVTAPLVTGSSAAPAMAPTSFSGIRPTERRRVSQSTRREAPGMGTPASSNRLSSTPSTRFRPKTSVTVV